ncbi:TOPRIM nucleotidyl transferase/hydrolase domain-containing protein [Actinoplanes sp. NPDC051859]|uniref:TOPRIM nucleotidyl transferase/hydrolase domain-containing protein n=1 Tax=Actinoplanes sp. NPDC051859 TaxID=3363909 RepID=UPI00378A6787
MERLTTAVILVEGDSDRIALETLAARRGQDLAARGVEVLSIGGAHAIARHIARFGPRGAGLRLAGLCDAAEADLFLRALTAAGIGTPQTHADLGRLGFGVCVADLEDELIRAVGVPGVEAAFAANGDLQAFRTLQNQVAWRGQPVPDQLRRFLGAGSRRKLRYARFLVEALDDDRVPKPLDAVLAAVT